MILFLTTAFASGERLFAPDKDLWERWLAFSPDSIETINHAPWDIFLKNYVVIREGDVARVNYKSVTDQSRADLDQYINQAQDIDIASYNRDEQLAFWVNLYNASIVKIVLDNYPVESIKDISSGFFSSGPWGDKNILVADEKLSFNDIEHRILRPIWNDLRLHYALNCGSLGCPPLQQKAMTAQNYDEYMETGARIYINSSHGVSIRNREIHISKIYDWYFEDFGETEQSLLTHLKAYAYPGLATKLEEINHITSVYYDWKLNGNEIN